MSKKRRKGKRKTKSADGIQSRAYEAAMSTPQRRHVYGAGGSQDAAADHALQRVRNWGRYLDENLDLAVGVLDELVKNVVGTGIQTIPKPLRPDKTVDEGLGEAIAIEFRRWARRADTTSELSWHEAQRQLCRGWFRDGEAFINHVFGRNRGYLFASTEVPYRVELLESEMCPWDLSGEGWRLGIRHNGWRQPVQYAIYLEHPEDIVSASGSAIGGRGLREFKVVPAEAITHLKHARRWPSTRGMSVFASVISRLYDVKDLEESERIKNRLLASWCAAVIKAPELIGSQATDENGARYLQTVGGTVIDTLAAGESIVGVGPDYPTQAMPEHIADQMRRIASGTGTRYSSIAKRYDGNYSSQRQELVETEGHYSIREDQFVQKVVRPVYERWLTAAALDGKIQLPRNEDLDMLANAEFRGPITPWIDPLKEAQADKLAVDEAFITREQVQIKRGMDADKIGMEPVREPAPRPAPSQLALIEDEDEDEAA